MSIDFILEAKKLKENIVNLRRTIHMNPELGLEEHATAQLVENTLNNMGIETKRIAGTGVVGILKGKQAGKTVALRADMDALPITDRKRVEYASKIQGKMHACGHDAHTAGLLGAAMLLEKHREYFAGQVKFLFQPAEETTGGALPMIKDGAMEYPKVDGVFGLHCNPDLEVGQIGITYGKAYAASDMFDVEIKGKSCHGAAPHNGIDAIAVGAQIVSSLQTIVARNVNPLDAAVITVGSFRGGYQRNVIADNVKLSGIIRTLDPQTRENVKNLFMKVVQGIGQAFGAEVDINMIPSYPALINDDKMVDIAYNAAKSLMRDTNVVILKQPTMGVEDFAYFLKEAPGAFLQLGVRNEAKGITYPLHSDLFDIDEDALPFGAAILSKIAFTYLLPETI